MDYKGLYKIWKSEKEKSELCPLPKGFYGNLSRYVKEIQEKKRVLDKGTIEAKLMDKEAENVSEMIRGLIGARCRKIIRAALEGEVLTEGMLAPEEKYAYDRLTSVTDAFDELLKDVLSGRQPQVKKGPAKGPKNMVVRLLQETPAIVGVNMKTYGPFKAEDVASLPVENAKMLIRRGVAVRVET